MNLNPGDIIDNLNNNYPTIIETAIKGYLEFYKLEQQFLSNIPPLNIQDLNSKPEVMNILISYANEIQHGKSYFANEILLTLIQEYSLTDYINIIGTQIPIDFKEPIKKGFVEELNIEEQKGGSKVIEYFFKFMAIFLITCISNVTSVSNSISPLAQVSVALNLEKGQIPRAIGFEGDLDPMNETSIIEFTRQYNPSAKFPEDRDIRINITETYEQEYLKNMKKGIGMIERILTTDKNFHSRFIANIKNETENINQLTTVTHAALEELCRSFTKTTDPKLPIPLFELLNSAMASKLEELQEKRRKIITEKEEELRAKKISQLQITSPEPSLIDITTSNLKSVTSGVSSKISNMFSWPFYSKKTEETYKTETETLTAVNSPSTEELVELYEQVDNSIYEEMNQLSQQIDTIAFTTLANDVISKLNEQAAEALKVTNLRIYLTAICHIKKPRYIFNETSGELYIKDPARSRTHLMVLAKNVVSYYDTVIQGLSYIKDGEIYIDVPDETRLLNMKSLREKSDAIVEILTTYDTELARTLSDSDETNVSDFFKNIASMWINIKTNMIDALAQFPMTERESKQVIERQKQETERKLREEQKRHELMLLERVQKLAQNQQLNNITAEEWNAINQYFSISTGGILGSGTAVINNLVNATTDIGNNLLDNTDLLLDKGFSSIKSVAWGIALLSMILSIPALFYLSLKTGLITAVFNNIKRKIDIPQEENQPTSIVPQVNPPVAPFQSTALTVPYNFGEDFKQEFGEELTQELVNMLQNLDINKNTNGGRRYNRGRLNRKTRKNKKRKTRKLKNKRRHNTRHKRKHLTKRH